MLIVEAAGAGEEQRGEARQHLRPPLRGVGDLDLNAHVSAGGMEQHVRMRSAVFVIIERGGLDGTRNIVDRVLRKDRHAYRTPDFEPFDVALNPSTENVALHVAENLHLPPNVKLIAVEVWETEQNSAVYRPR